MQDKTQVRLTSLSFVGPVATTIGIIALFTLFELTKHLLHSDFKTFLDERTHSNTILLATIVAVAGVGIAFLRERRIRVQLAAEIEDHLRAVNSLRIVERHYRTLFESNLAGVIRTSLDGTVLECNDALAHLMRFESSAQLVGANFHAFCRSDGFEHILERLQQEELALTNVELAVQCFDGALAWLQLNASVVQSATGDREIEITSLDITGRKNTEEALRKTERQYEFLFESNPHPMWVFDVETLEFRDVNEVALRQYGYTREEFLRMRVCDIRPPEDVPAFLQRVSGLHTGLNDTRVWRHRRKDGSICKVEITGFYFTADGKHHELVLANDVTEREGIREQLEQSQAQMLGILGSAMDAIITVDSGHNIVLFNSAAENIFGCAACEVIGTPIDRFVPDQLRMKHSAGFDQFAHSDGHYRFGVFTAQAADGRQFPIEASISQIEVSGQKLYTIILRDITRRRLAEEQQKQLQSAIERAARDWKSMFDAVSSALLVVFTDGRVERLNRAAKDLFGVELYTDVIGRAISDFVAREPWRETAKVIAEAFASRASVTTQVCDERGSTWSVSASMAADERVGDRVIVVIRDVTQIVELQDSLRRSETMASMGALVAGIAHEVRNPLFGISSTIDTFEACFGDRTEFEEYISILRGEVERLKKLMQELLEYGRPLSNEFAPGSISQIVDNAIRVCSLGAKQARVSVKVAYDNDLPPVHMNSARLMLLFKNIIENAIQHSPAGGEVLIETHLSETDGHQVVCMIADSGPGFREQDLPRVFEPFFSRRQGGTGLGLSIVQRVAEEHSGTVRGTNRAGGGALVEVALPLSRSESGSNAES